MVLNGEEVLTRPITRLIQFLPRTLDRVLGLVRKIASRKYKWRFLRQDEIAVLIQDCERDLKDALDTFDVSLPSLISVCEPHKHSFKATSISGQRYLDSTNNHTRNMLKYCMKFKPREKLPWKRWRISLQRYVTLTFCHPRLNGD